ncbi:MAG TPA: VTT domain-containing protein [Thermoanaerobaculia bacterium]|nr:VTT domain-containing protein [Thermoanaerobaculia bacterium]
MPLLTMMLAVIAVALVATRLGDIPAARAAVETMRSGADEWWAVPLFVALYALFTLLFLPVGLLSAAAALTWGWKVGGTIELLTCTAVSTLPFFLARRGLAPWIERRIAKEHMPVLESPFTLFLLRVVPLVPYVALNYLAGATRVRTRDYVLTTFLGILPSTYLFAYFVDTMAGAAIGVATHAKIAAACVLVAVVAIAMKLAVKRLRV